MFILKSRVWVIGGYYSTTILAKSRDNEKILWSQDFELRCRDELEFKTVKEACDYLYDRYFDMPTNFYPSIDETEIYYINDGYCCKLCDVGTYD